MNGECGDPTFSTFRYSWLQYVEPGDICISRFLVRGAPDESDVATYRGFEALLESAVQFAPANKLGQVNDYDVLGILVCLGVSASPLASIDLVLRATSTEVWGGHARDETSDDALRATKVVKNVWRGDATVVLVDRRMIDEDHPVLKVWDEVLPIAMIRSGEVQRTPWLEALYRKGDFGIQLAMGLADHLELAKPLKLKPLVSGGDQQIPPPMPPGGGQIPSKRDQPDYAQQFVVWGLSAVAGMLLARLAVRRIW